MTKMNGKRGAAVKMVAALKGIDIRCYDCGGDIRKPKTVSCTLLHAPEVRE